MSESVMKEILLSQEELNAMRHAYEKEYIELSRRVEHLKSVLGKLGSDLPLTADAGAIAAPAPARVAKATKKRGRKKKRGPKSVWGDFIVTRLKSVDRPMSYEEMLKDALVLKNVPEEKVKNAKASILNSAFRLRTVHKKIDTVGEEGKKMKYMVLKRWLNDDGKLQEPYKSRFEQILATTVDKEVEVKPKRGPGRPRKNPEAAPIAKKGPGRPRKNPEAAPIAKKGPGRTTKSPEAAPIAKKGTEQPRKKSATKTSTKPTANKRGPGSSRKNTK